MNKYILAIAFLVFISKNKMNIEKFTTQKKCNKCIRQKLKIYKNKSSATDRCISSGSCDTRLAMNSRPFKKYKRRKKRKFFRNNYYYNVNDKYRYFDNYHNPMYILPVYPNSYPEYNLYDCVQCINTINADYLDFNEKFRLCNNAGRCNIFI